MYSFRCKYQSFPLATVAFEGNLKCRAHTSHLISKSEVAN